MGTIPFNPFRFGATARSTCLLARCRSRWDVWGRSWRCWPERWRSGSSLRSRPSCSPAPALLQGGGRWSERPQRRTYSLTWGRYLSWAGRQVRGRSHRPTQSHHLQGFIISQGMWWQGKCSVHLTGFKLYLLHLWSFQSWRTGSGSWLRAVGCWTLEPDCVRSGHPVPWWGSPTSERVAFN